MSRFRLYPTAAQQVLLLEACGHARYVWNLALEQRNMWRRDRPHTPNYVAQARQLTEARREFAWLAAGSVTVQQQALRDHGQAWQNFFAGTHGRPTWRKRGQHEGFRIVGAEAQRVRRDNGRWSAVNVPKVGWVRFKRSRALPDFKSYRVTRDRAGRWHIAFAAVPDPVPAPGTGDVVGVDRGVKVAAALSTGELSSPAGLRRREAQRLLRLQRRLVRARKGSGRRERVKRQIARLRVREADRRKDWAEKTSTGLARGFDVIGVEDLNVKGMTGSARGTMTKPGRNVRQKAGLNRGILAAGWGLLVARLEHKAPGRVVRIDPAFTSQTCHACGHRAPENRKRQAVFRCVACGHQAHADVNAARNIRSIAAGLAVTARGDRVKSARSVKREPQRKRVPTVA
ncbi:RNA-guided endonuclease InsQ/TnpB family protein [Kineosporia babensis]|uniref:Transposase n=1 Tax=Kineosporia babensis TaxID=499548 RepID=A0A9X1SWW0_9ACTN|nr:transposase [Kineosporia babensis]MCD5314455.1 transposase [Kineosporia babensis]